MTAPATGTLRHSKKSRPAPPPPIGRNQPPQNGTAVKVAPPPTVPKVTTAPPEDVKELIIRDPAELLIGMPATLTTQWRHAPNALVNGFVSYSALVSSIFFLL